MVVMVDMVEEEEEVEVVVVVVVVVVEEMVEMVEEEGLVAVGFARVSASWSCGGEFGSLAHVRRTGAQGDERCRRSAVAFENELQQLYVVRRPNRKQATVACRPPPPPQPALHPGLRATKTASESQ
jgi:hypothetical protein